MSDAYTHYSDAPFIDTEANPVGLVVRTPALTDFGYVCERCGLSDVGRERLCRYGFQARPCAICRDHFGEAEQ